MPRRRPEPPPDPRRQLTVHPDWRAQVGGIAAPALCDIRAATLPDLHRGAALLARAGCPDPCGLHGGGDSLFLLAWSDPDAVAPADGGPRRPGAGSGGRACSPSGAAVEADPGWDRARGPDHGPQAVGCVEIRWLGSRDPDIRYRAGDSVELACLQVEPALRRRGIGRALLAAAEHRCLLAGRSRIVASLPWSASRAGTHACATSAPASRVTPGAPERDGRAGYRPLCACGGATGAVAAARPPGPVACAHADRVAGRVWWVRDIPEPGPSRTRPGVRSRPLPD